jgi:hypothetical protein
LLSSRSTLPYVEQHIPELAAAVRLAGWSLERSVEDYQLLEAGAQNGPQRWSDDLVPVGAKEHIKSSLLRHERVAIRVPIFVRRASASQGESAHFEIYLEHHDEESVLRPIFFREQLLVSGVKRAMGVPKVRSLVVIGEGVLADLLRAAEPPNHTDWDPKTGNFRNEFRDGIQVITFVKTAVKQLLTMVRSGDDEPDPNVTIDFFAVPDDENSKARNRATTAAADKDGDGTKKKKEFPEPKPRKFYIRMTERGFTIVPKRGAPLPDRLHVSAAYDLLSGNPFSQYEPLDFDFNEQRFKIATGADSEVRVTSSNSVDIEIAGPDFETSVVGFDPLRDLIVRAYEPGTDPDDDSATELHEAEEADS